MLNRFRYFSLIIGFFIHSQVFAVVEQAMQNIDSRKCISLDGKWNVIADPWSQGQQRKVWLDQTPKDKTYMVEVNFEGGLMLDVPGDWNSQRPEFEYYEATMWYKRSFNYERVFDKRVFLHFAGVSNYCTVYLNHKEIGSHVGAFTPFQMEITDLIKSGENNIIVRVDNRRDENMIPSLSFDWWNYGGITRSVRIVETPLAYIKDYHVQLLPNSNQILVQAALNGEMKGQKIQFRIPELKIEKEIMSDNNGNVNFKINANPVLWTPEQPKLYDVTLKCGNEMIQDKIGFRTIAVEGENILLNGKSIFLKGVNVHEEMGQYKKRPTTMDEYKQLINNAIDLGCNFIRLGHYSPNEAMVKYAESKGMMLWEEIPIWQNINFSNSETEKLAHSMLEEMIARDKNRCAIILWSIANETPPNAPSRNTMLKNLAKRAKQLDPNRLVTAAFDNVRYQGDDLVLQDFLIEYLDVVGVNKYMGWYQNWKGDPAHTKWILAKGKPVIMSEFGGEAVYGNYGPADNASSWSEEYNSKVYRDNLISFSGISNLRGLSPWIMMDFRSPRRWHAMYQQGWNRKGLLSPLGDKKHVWYIMNEFYKTKPTYIVE